MRTARAAAMNALLLAAGRGNRLRPLTDYIPKPLLPIVNRPVIDLNIIRIRETGIRGLGINLWYKSDELVRFLEQYRDLTIAKEKKLLGTGGALHNFRDFVTKDFLVHNADIVTSINLSEAIVTHRREQPIATLVLTHNPGTNVVRLEQDMRVSDISDQEHQGCYTFTGVAVLSQRIFDFFPMEEVFSMIDVYRGALQAGEHIAGLISDNVWYDIGSHKQYWQVHHDLHNRIISLPQLGDIEQQYIDKTSIVHSQSISGFVSIGPRCRIGAQVSLRNTVVFGDSTIEHGNYTNALISDHFCITVE